MKNPTSRLAAGFGRADITPRVGVELCGFGPYLNRHSIAVRDRLWARAVALRQDETTLLLVSCDLIGITLDFSNHIRALLAEKQQVPAAAVMIHCTHTHSGPATIPLIGWGEMDPPYMELLPHKIVQACEQALQTLEPVQIQHAEVPCEGMALNREYDRDAPPLEDVLNEEWRPAKPELTDTTCHVLKLTNDTGSLKGFLSYFGCHPVVCCAQSRYIHGDYAGVAINMLEREFSGCTGLFLQGAQGDVNSCVVHKSEQEALLALDIVAARFARSVRQGLLTAQPLTVDALQYGVREVAFKRQRILEDSLTEQLTAAEARLTNAEASDEDREMRMATVHALALRRLLGRLHNGENLAPKTILQMFAIGPLLLTATPFEVFQAIKNDYVQQSRAPIPLLLGLTNDLLGYAPDRTAAARGGYAAQQVPAMLGELPFADVHGQLLQELQQLEEQLGNDS